jgi:hypothetical protein
MVDNLLVESGTGHPRESERNTTDPQNELNALNQAASSTHNWWKIADIAVLLAWVCVTNFTIRYHEKWADEAQAWLIARDLDLRTIWLHELRYEGSPGLWHTILWIAQHVFHARYGAIGYIGLIGATAGAALLIFKAPFPRFIRWPLAFTYFMVYQYAVIARPYTLLPLLAFAAAMLFKDIRHPERMTVVLVLLANLSLHGTIIAGCLGLAYLIEAAQSWRTLEPGVRARYQICVAAMALVFLFLFIILKPTPDIEEFVMKKRFAKLPPAAQALAPTPLRKVTDALSGAFLDYTAPSVLFVALAAAWCFMRRKFLAFALPVGSLIALYAIVHGAAHHHGTMFAAAIAGLWIAWPSAEEKGAFSQRQRWAMQGMMALLLCLCALNLWDSAVVIQREYLYPYCGAEDAAKYLKSVGADKGPLFGFLYGMVGVQAYFDHNILSNVPSAYFHHGLPLDGTSLDEDELRRINPEYIVAYSQNPELMLQANIPHFNELGYQIVHFSDGYYLYKRKVFEREVYFILRRTHAGASSDLEMLPPR